MNRFYGRVMRPSLIVVGCLLGSIGMPRVGFAQQTVATAVHAGVRDADAKALLARRVTVQLDRVSLRTAIDQTAAQAKVLIGYQHEILDATGRTVTLHATAQPLGAVLDQMLAGTKLYVVVTAPDAIGLKMAENTEGDSTHDGTIAGVVRNTKTKQPLPGITVTLDDRANVVRTDLEGRYRFLHVSSGTHRLTVRAIGFTRQVQPVTVKDHEGVVVDFALVASVNTLDQVVVTATGAQRVRELGHVIATINADSLVRSAPITDVTELLQSRVPGLQVITGDGGMAGSSATLQLRGRSSVNLSSEPIVIVDGVRYKSNNLGANDLEDDYGRRLQTTLRSPLNDLNPNDIATVEVVKGASASTLYGPDAANGVIIVTTKRGQPGANRFQWYARPVTSDVPVSRVSSQYHIWAHDPNNPTVQVPFACDLRNQYVFKNCVLDSITVSSSSVDVDSLSVLAKNRPTWQYGASLSGGSPALQYYASGNYTSQTGVLQIPPAIQHLMTAKYGAGAVTDQVRNPNTLNTVGTQLNVSSSISPLLTLNGTVNVTHVMQSDGRPSVFQSAVGLGTVPSVLDSAGLANFVQNTYNYDLAFFTSTQETNRFTGSGNAVYRPMPWLTVSATAGMDLDNLQAHGLRPGGTTSTSDAGFVSDERRNSVNRNLSLNATASAHPGILSFRSSVGMEYQYQRLDGLDIEGTGLPVGSHDIGLAQNVSHVPTWIEKISLGGFGEEVVGVYDQLFVTGGLRLDGSTTFGEDYHPTPYPKIGVSWIASEAPFLRTVPGLRELRFRYSYGSAAKQPLSLMRYGQLSASLVTFEGITNAAYINNELGSDQLKPERSNESEYGVDLTTIWDIRAELTWHRKTVHDELENIDETRIGLPNIYGNTASIASHGFEATLQVPVFNTTYARGDVAVNYAYNTSKVLHLVSNYAGLLGVGYPVDAVFGNPILGVDDTVGNTQDHIVFPQEIVRDTASRFLGVTQPPRTLTVTPSLALLSGHLRVSTLIDRQAGFVVRDVFAMNCRTNATCLAPFLVSTPLLTQAKYQGGHPEDFLAPGDFTRWRELTLSADLPLRWTRWLRLGNASVSLQGRNLALWTAYKGADPESHADYGLFGTNVSGIPQARSWSFRFDVTP